MKTGLKSVIFFYFAGLMGILGSGYLPMCDAVLIPHLSYLSYKTEPHASHGCVSKPLAVACDDFCFAALALTLPQFEFPYLVGTVGINSYS